MKIFLTTCLLCLSFSLSAQLNDQDLVGKWMFEALQETEELDSSMVAMFNGMLTGTYYHFSENGQQRVNSMGKEGQGSWSVFGQDSVRLVDQSGVIAYQQIRRLNDKELLLIHKEMKMLMVKEDLSKEELQIEFPKPVETIAASKELIAKEWKLSIHETAADKEKTGEMRELADALTRAGFLYLYEDGTCISGMGGFESKGVWKFENDKHSFLMKLEGGEKIWNIVSLSETELILVGGTLVSEPWIYNLK